jgi:MYND finger
MVWADLPMAMDANDRLRKVYNAVNNKQRTHILIALVPINENRLSKYFCIFQTSFEWIRQMLFVEVDDGEVVTSAGNGYSCGSSRINCDDDIVEQVSLIIYNLHEAQGSARGEYLNIPLSVVCPSPGDRERNLNGIYRMSLAQKTGAIVNLQKMGVVAHLCHVCKRICAAKKCQRCHKTVYCDEHCQRYDWPQHKQTCTRVGS